MRITGGKARGIPLKAPKGNTTRPATDRLREAVFSSLGATVEGCRVADLFAGTGSYGLESLSRGAASATFYENNRSAVTVLRENIKNAQRSFSVNAGNTAIVTQDVFLLAPDAGQFDLIFLDPPYATLAASLDTIFEKVVSRIAAGNAKAVVELPGNLNPTIEGWQTIRRIGKTGRDKPTALILQQSL